MQKFCHDCGKQLTGLSIAKFCPHCGTNLTTLASKAPAPPPVPTPPAPTYARARVDEDDDDLPNFEVRIDKLEVEIMKPQQRQETIASVMAHPTAYIPNKESAPKLGKKEIKAMVAQTLAEGAAIKPQERVRKTQS